MTTILTQYGLLTYENYIKAFENWVETGTSSAAISTPSLTEFTRLNWARTKRLNKTIELRPEFMKLVDQLPHTYTWIVLTEAWCGDSAQSLPVIAAIAALDPNKIKLLIALRDQHTGLMDQHLTNGARSIPKLISIDDVMGTENFEWGPRPADAQVLLTAWKKNPGARSWDEFEKELHSWYAQDKTNSIQQEFIDLLAANIPE